MTTKGPTNLNQRVGGLAEFVRNARLVWRLLQDARVPFWQKLIIPLTLLYLISPLDFIPDVFLGVGQLDDLGIILLGLWLFLELVPKVVVKEHREEMGGTVDVSYRVVDDEEKKGTEGSQGTEGTRLEAGKPQT